MPRARFGAEASAPFCSACGDIGIGQKCGTNGNNFYTSFTIHIFWGLIIGQVNVLICLYGVVQKLPNVLPWRPFDDLVVSLLYIYIYHISYIYIYQLYIP